MSTLLEQASLVMIPSGYKEDVVYSQIPTSGAGDLSFTRASNGTRVNSAGLVEVCPWNLAGYSEEFNNAYWTKAGATITANDTTAPNGVATADKVLANSGNTEHGVYNGAAFASNFVGEVYTYSVYAKKGTVDWLVLDHYQGSYTFTWFNLNTGTVGTVASGVTATIESVGNGWYRCSCTKAITATTLNYIGIYLSNANNTWSFNAAGTESIYIWGAQVNLGTAKPYFPTTDRLNVPRLTYQNGGGGCPSLLLEKQSTNYCKWSNDLTQSSAWIDQTYNTTITQITSGGPDGGSFTRLVSTGSGNMGRMVQSGSITNPNGATMSVYLKGSGTAGIALFIGNGISQYTEITLTNTWTRYTVSVSGAGSTYQDWQITCFGGSTIDVSFVQIEVSSYATSPIYTTSSSATRVADACYKTGISSLFGTNQGTFFIDFVYYGSEQFSYIFDVTDSANSNRFLMYDSNGSGLYVLYDTSAGVWTTTQLTKGQRYKIAVKYNSTATYWYINGTFVGNNGGFAFAYQMSQIYLGIRYSISDNTGMQVNESIVFPTALTNAELASLTTI